MDKGCVSQESEPCLHCAVGILQMPENVRLINKKLFYPSGKGAQRKELDLKQRLKNIAIGGVMLSLFGVFYGGVLGLFGSDFREDGDIRIDLAFLLLTAVGGVGFLYIGLRGITGNTSLHGSSLREVAKGVTQWWSHFLILVFLGVAFVEWKEYGVFTLIRFALCAVFVRLSWEASRSDDARWVWIWGILAAAYNPFVPLSLGRSVWVWVNWGPIGTVIFDVIRRSKEPLKTLKLTLMLGAFLAVLWGITVGGKYYFSEVLPEQQAKAAERQELEAHEKTWSGEEQRKRSDDN
jgi:hypothetical protein